MEIAQDEGAKIRNLSQLIVLLGASHLLDYPLGVGREDVFSFRPYERKNLLR